MKVLISGHRTEKLKQYDQGYLQLYIEEAILFLQKKYGYIIGLSGMANGIDLVFCASCWEFNIRYYACPPFEEQEEYMSDYEKQIRNLALEHAEKIYKIRNSQMIEMADAGIIVWDGNRGYTQRISTNVRK